MPGVISATAKFLLGDRGYLLETKKARLLQHAIVKLSWRYEYMLRLRPSVHCPPLEEHFSE